MRFNWLYVLDDNGIPVPEPDIIKWGTWMQSYDPQVALDVLPSGVTISTVFLGQANICEPPELPDAFETAVFSKAGIRIPRRYKTLAEAKRGHIEIRNELTG